MKRNPVQYYVWLGSALMAIAAYGGFRVHSSQLSGSSADWSGVVVALMGAGLTAYGIYEQKKTTTDTLRREEREKQIQYAKEWYDDLTSRMDSLEVCTNDDVPIPDISVFEGVSAIRYLSENWHEYLYGTNTSQDRFDDPDIEQIEYLLRRLIDLEIFIRDNQLQKHLYLYHVEISKILKVSDPEVEKTYNASVVMPRDKRRAFIRMMELLKKLPTFE